MVIHWTVTLIDDHSYHEIVIWLNFINNFIIDTDIVIELNSSK